jgi:CxC2 like cysteine cluster associated with KDZ transposases
MKSWKANKEMLYLDVLLESEASPTTVCTTCKLSIPTSSEIWRCKDCFSRPLYCRSCCKAAHARDPFHRVEIWNSTHFTPSWLWRTGLSLSLCPRGACSALHTTPAYVSGIPDADDSTFGAQPGFRMNEDMRTLVVVHTNGIHHILVNFCSCSAAPTSEEPTPDDIQLLRVGLYPASHLDIRTAFTFAVLDDYLLDNLECYTSAFHFFSKLARLTNEVFPRKVKVILQTGVWLGVASLNRNSILESIPRRSSM